jgi:plastocyanin
MTCRAPLLLSLLALILGLAACGEDRGSVNVEGSGTGSSTTGTGGTSTTGETSTAEETSTASGEEASARPDQTITVTADPGGQLKFTKNKLTAKPGVVKFVLTNPSTLQHALEIEGNGIEEETPAIRQNGTAELTVTLEAGEYKYYCPVGSHEEAGMTGTLTVK